MRTLNRYVLDLFRAVAGWRDKAAGIVTATPAWPEIERAARAVTAPVRGFAHATLRALPGLRKVEWLFEVERLTRIPPVMLAVSLGFTLWRGLRPTSLGHIGTDTVIYPFIGALSYFNPFLGMLSGVVYGIGDLAQKLVWNDIYGASGRGQNYWGAMLGYVFAYSALVTMGLLPGVLSRVGATLARRIAHAWLSRAAVAAADGGVPIDASLAPGQPAAELAGAMIGAAVGGGVTMHQLAPTLEQPAFYGAPLAPDALQRATPDVGCHALEVQTYLKGRALTAGALGTAVAGPAVQLATNPGAGPASDPGGTPPQDDEPGRAPRRGSGGATSPLLQSLLDDASGGRFGAPDVDGPSDDGGDDSEEAPDQSTLPQPPIDEEGRTTVPGTCERGHRLDVGSTYCRRCWSNNDPYDLAGFTPDGPVEQPPQPPIDEEGRTTVPGTCQRGHHLEVGSTYCRQCWSNNDSHDLTGFTPDGPDSTDTPAETAPQEDEPADEQPQDEAEVEPAAGQGPDQPDEDGQDETTDDGTSSGTEEGTDEDEPDDQGTGTDPGAGGGIGTGPNQPQPGGGGTVTPPVTQSTTTATPTTTPVTPPQPPPPPTGPVELVPIEGDAAKAYLQSIGAWDEARNAPREDATFTGGYDTETQRLVVLIPSSDPAAPPPDPVVDDVDRSDRPVYSGEPAQSRSSTGTSAPIGMVANVMNQTLSGQGIWGAPPLSGSPLGVPDAAPGDIPLPSSQPLAQQTHQADFTPDENPGGVQATRQVNALEDAGVPAQTVTDQNGNVYVRPPRPEDVPYGTDLGYRTTVITRPDGTRLEVVDPNAPIRVNRPDEGATE